MEDVPEIRSDIWEQETAFYDKFTNLIPKYLQSNKYQIIIEDQDKYRNEIKEKIGINMPNLVEHL